MVALQLQTGNGNDEHGFVKVMSVVPEVESTLFLPPRHTTTTTPIDVIGRFRAGES